MIIIKLSRSEAVGQDVVPVHVVVAELADSHRLPVLPLVHWRLAAALALPLAVYQETAVGVRLHSHSDLVLKGPVVLGLRVLRMVDASHAVRVSLLDEAGHSLLLETTDLFMGLGLMFHSERISRLVFHGIALKLELFIRTAPELERTATHHPVLPLPWSALEEISEGLLGLTLRGNVGNQRENGGVADLGLIFVVLGGLEKVVVGRVGALVTVAEPRDVGLLAPPVGIIGLTQEAGHVAGVPGIACETHRSLLRAYPHGLGHLLQIGALRLSLIILIPRHADNKYNYPFVLLSPYRLYPLGPETALATGSRETLALTQKKTLLILFLLLRKLCLDVIPFQTSNTIFGRSRRLVSFDEHA